MPTLSTWRQYQGREAWKLRATKRIKHCYADCGLCTNQATRQSPRDRFVNRLVERFDYRREHDTKRRQITWWICPDGSMSGVERKMSESPAMSEHGRIRPSDFSKAPHRALRRPYRCMAHHAATTKALTAGHATFRASLVKAQRTPTSCL